MDQFYVCSELPEVFRLADELYKPKEPKYVKSPIPERERKPGPRIDSNPNVPGPMRVTQEWYDKKKAKQERKRNEHIRDCKIRIMQLLAERDYLRERLATLNPAKKKDAREIATINFELDEIQKELDMLGTESGIYIDELDHGTRFQRFIGRTAAKIKKGFKKVKKFFKRHSEDIITCVIGIGIPVLGVIIASLGVK